MLLFAMMMEELLLVLNLADLADDKKVVKEVTGQVTGQDFHSDFLSLCNKNFESYFWAAGSIVFSDSFCSGVLVKVLPLRPLGPLSGFLKNNLMRGDNLMRKK